MIRCLLRLWAIIFVVTGALYAFTGRNREAALWLLITGLVFAVAFLLIDRREQR